MTISLHISPSRQPTCRQRMIIRDFSRRHSLGYTLIEVLVAMMILSMSLTVLLQIFSTGLRNVEVSSDYTRAVIIAEARLAETNAAATLQLGEYSGTEDDLFNWTRTIEDYVVSADREITELPVSAYQVTVAVEWEHAGRVRQIRLSSVRLASEKT